jgi:hypothetical protein
LAKGKYAYSSKSSSRVVPDVDWEDKRVVADIAENLMHQAEDGGEIKPFHSLNLVRKCWIGVL